MDEFGLSVTTRLLTLLNVSATKVGKRKRPEEEVSPASVKAAKRRSISFAEKDIVFDKSSTKKNPVKSKKQPKEDASVSAAEDSLPAQEDTADVVDDDDAPDAIHLYEEHFGVSPKVLTEAARNSVDKGQWKTSREQAARLGSVLVSIPDNAEASTSSTSIKDDVAETLKAPFMSRQSKESNKQAAYQADFLSTLATRKDLYISSSTLDKKPASREVIALHALNHVHKKRKRVLKNNERLAKAAKANPDAPVTDDDKTTQDQGFIRPSVLILLPFRSFAVDWFRALTSHLPSPQYQVENQSRFLSEYGLPEDVVDKLTSAEPGTYPPDHVDMFKGNVDDNFRVGVKRTRKTVKMFADFYGCDIIIASPLGLRRSIEKEKNGDYLSSIEILVVDQMDALTMQNWEHVNFVMSHLNQLPKESHDTDFSRIKPWYLEAQAAYLRQSILLTAYETPETRSLFSSLKNVAGKIRTEKRYQPIDVPAGVQPQFIHFDSSNPTDEPDKRFNHFTTQVLPSILKSAVQSSNTIIFIPSSFDFIRVQEHFRKQVTGGGASYAVLSEYSSNADISRARLAFFKGQKSFLLVSERFHFYKRYKLRGCRNVVFYGPPDHPQFFTEFLSFPFLDGAESGGVDPSDVTCKVLFSKYDKFRLERIMGTEAAMELIKTS